MYSSKQSSMFTSINVTPLTDVFLVLLVIMILIIPLANNAVIKVNPGDGTDNCGHRGSPEPHINVLVQSNGDVCINGKVLKKHDAVTVQKEIEHEKLSLRSDDPALYVHCDRSVLQKDMVAVMDAAMGAGIKRLSVASVNVENKLSPETKLVPER